MDWVEAIKVPSTLKLFSPKSSLGKRMAAWGIIHRDAELQVSLARADCCNAPPRVLARLVPNINNLCVLKARSLFIFMAKELGIPTSGNTTTIIYIYIYIYIQVTNAKC